MNRFGQERRCVRALTSRPSGSRSLRWSRRVGWMGLLVTAIIAAPAAGVSLIADQASAGVANAAQHAAITITSNADFTAGGAATGCGCVTRWK